MFFVGSQNLFGYTVLILGTEVVNYCELKYRELLYFASSSPCHHVKCRLNLLLLVLLLSTLLQLDITQPWSCLLAEILPINCQTRMLLKSFLQLCGFKRLILSDAVSFIGCHITS